MITIKKAIRELKKCSADCINCGRCQIKIADITDHITVYAWYCDIADEAGYLWYGEWLDALREETLNIDRDEANSIFDEKLFCVIPNF